jgi:hypothetical protein
MNKSLEVATLYFDIYIFLLSGERSIMEYEIMDVQAFKELKTYTPILNGSYNKKKIEISRMVVQISFRRKISYHVANTFLQVCLNKFKMCILNINSLIFYLFLHPTK